MKPVLVELRTVHSFGAQASGRVMRLARFGAFAELGNCFVLLDAEPVAELALATHRDPAHVVAPG
jgi:hypothetical protein